MHYKHIIFFVIFVGTIFTQTNPAIIQQLTNMTKEQLNKKLEEVNVGNNTEKKSTNINQLNKNLSITDDLLETIATTNELKDAKGITSRSIFGNSFFKNINSLPKTYGPVPDSYLIGSGDEFIITLFGETSLSNELTVDRENNIVPENVGKINFSGLNFLEAKRIIKEKYSKVYSTIKGNPGKTQIYITVGKHRKIHLSVLGLVNSPGTFILSSLNSVYDALVTAGGPLETASVRNLQIKRGAKVIDFDVYTDIFPNLKKETLLLEDNDIIFVGAEKRQITINGGVRLKGSFEISKNTTMTEIIQLAGGIEADAELEFVSISTIQNDVEKILKFNTLEETFKYTFKDGDKIFVNQKSISRSSFVEMVGSVLFPGKYAFEENQTIIKYLNGAGGFKQDTYLKRFDISRRLNDYKRKMITISEKDLETFKIQDGDVLYVYSKESFNEFRKVNLISYHSGNFEYNFEEESDIFDYISRIGGIKYDEDNTYVEVVRLIDGDENNYAKLYQIKLFPDYLEYEANKLNEFKLKPDDIIIIRKNTKIENYKNITIIGEIVSAGSYPIISKSERISDIIKRAKGFKNSAYINGIKFYRAVNKNFRVLDKIDVTKGNFDFTRKEFTESSKINDINLDQIRIPIDFEKIMEDSTSEENIFIQDNDYIFIPKNSNIVVVQGEVNSPGAIVFIEGKSVEFYLQQAGGLTEFADNARIQVVKANGKNLETGLFKFDQIDAGTVITIPPKVLQDQSNTILTTIFTSLSTIVTLLVLIKQL